MRPANPASSALAAAAGRHRPTATAANIAKRSRGQQSDGDPQQPQRSQRSRVSQRRRSTGAAGRGAAGAVADRAAPDRDQCHRRHACACAASAAMARSRSCPTRANRSSRRTSTPGGARSSGSARSISRRSRATADRQSGAGSRRSAPTAASARRSCKRSSGRKEIDQAALSILRLASPFDPFPPELRKQYDELRFAYEWQFLGGGAQIPVCGQRTAVRISRTVLTCACRQPLEPTGRDSILGPCPRRLPHQPVPDRDAGDDRQQLRADGHVHLGTQRRRRARHHHQPAAADAAGRCVRAAENADGAGRERPPAGAARRARCRPTAASSCITIGGQWEHTRQVSSRIQVTTSPDILDAMARGSGPETALVALGYAGWSAGQLENETRAERLAHRAVRRAHPVRHALRAALACRRPPARHRPGHHQPPRRTCLMAGEPASPAPPATDPRVRLRNPPHRRRQRRHAHAHGARPDDARLRARHALARDRQARARLSARAARRRRCPYNMDGTPTALTAASRAASRAELDGALSQRPWRWWMSAESRAKPKRSCAKRARPVCKRGRATHADVDMIAARILLERWFADPRQAKRSTSNAAAHDRNVNPSNDPAPVQRDADGRLRHLITLEGLSREELTGAARSRAVLRARARRPARPRPEPRRAHRRQPVLRAQHAHARVVRARGAAARRGRRQPRHAVLVAREGRDRARHDLHAAGHARGHPGDARRRARPAGVRRAATSRRTSAF